MNRIDFDSDVEIKMASASLWGHVVAICSIATALLALPFDHSLAGLAGFGIQLALGVLLLIASRSFGRVARSDEDDHRHLLTGFRHLRAYFLVQAILILLAVAVLGVMIVREIAA